MSDATSPGFDVKAYAAASAEAPLAPTTIRRREPGPRDVQIQVLYCGVCHSDVHQARNEWQATNPTTYPCVPGHEIVGRVARAGREVKRLKEGDLAGVGCLVDSCRRCEACRAGQEQFCEGPATFTYNSADAHLGGTTFGGYSASVVVDQDFVLRIPDGADPAATAPLLCAGITTYSPLRHWSAGEGRRVGIVGLGGLGHVAVKFARALEAHVSVFTTSPGKAADALRLGAHDVVMSTDPEQMAAQAGSFDFILDTVSALHDLNPYVAALRRDGTMTLVGAPPEPSPVAAMGLIFGRKRLAGSLIGGIRETQEMLDFAHAHGIGADVELIPMAGINEAYRRLLRSDVKYRFVVDMASLRDG